MQQNLILLDGLLMPKVGDKNEAIKKLREAVTYVAQKSDVLIISYPKSGTTWIQYIVWLLMNDNCFDDLPYVNQMWYTLGPQLELNDMEQIARISSEEPCRQFKTHLPSGYVSRSEGAKMIYIARNPWDVCVSYFRNVKDAPQVFGFENATFDDFVQCFVKGECAWGDHLDHVSSWIKHSIELEKEGEEEGKKENSLLILTYEEISFDYRNSILKIAAFLGFNYVAKLLDNNEAILHQMIEATSFERMKNLPLIVHVSDETLKQVGKLDAGKNVDLVKQGKFKYQSFFKIGTVGYGKKQFSETQREMMISYIREKRRQHECLHKLFSSWEKYHAI